MNFLQNFEFPQTLKVYFRFQHKIAKMGPFPLKSRGSGVPLDAVRNLAPFGPQCENALENYVFTIKMALHRVKGSNPELSKLILGL